MAVTASPKKIISEFGFKIGDILRLRKGITWPIKGKRSNLKIVDMDHSFASGNVCLDFQGIEDHWDEHHFERMPK